MHTACYIIINKHNSVGKTFYGIIIFCYICISNEKTYPAFHVFSNAWMPET